MTTAIKHRNTPSRDADAEVGKRAHMLIWSRSLKQGDVANKINMSSGSLGLKLKGQRGWAVAEIIAIAHVLGTTVAYLVGETENTHQSPDGGDSSRLRDLNARPVLYKGNPSHEAIITPIRKVA